MPCGVQITRKKHIHLLSKEIEYIGTLDATISGSRNGLTPIFIWYILNKKGHMGIKRDVKGCLELAQYLENRLKSKGFWTLRNQLSTTVVFDKPKDNKIVLHWQLSCQGKMARVVVMPHVTIQVLDDFIDQLLKQSFCNQN